MKTISIVATLVSVAALAYLLVANALVANTITGAVMQIAAVCLMIWARITFGTRSFHFSANTTQGSLIMTGPYRYIRHPIYTSVVMVTVTAMLSYLSLRTFVLGLIVIAGTIARALIEESMLRKTYGEYAAYADRTWRMIPFLF